MTTEELRMRIMYTGPHRRVRTAAGQLFVRDEPQEVDASLGELLLASGMELATDDVESSPEQPEVEFLSPDTSGVADESDDDNEKERLDHAY